MANIFSPPKYFQLFAECVDDSLPKFKPDNWIVQGRWYKVKYLADALNTDGIALTITNNKDEIIEPSSTMSSFKFNRFIIHEVCLN